MVEKKILFLKAGSGWKDPSPPISFSYLGAIAKKEGFKVFVENLNAQYNKTTIDDIIRLVKKENPIVGITIFTNYTNYSYDLIKKIRPYAELIMVGGPHVTIYPEEAIDMGADIVVIGEAEAIFGDLLKAIINGKNLEKVRGIVFKKETKVGEIKIIKTKAPNPIEINTIPLPDKDIHRKSDYIQTKEEINNFGGILSSRGCPGQCTYCYHSLFGRCFRYRSAENVFKEVKYLYKKYGINHINFIDDAFTINRKRLMELCNLFIGANLPIEWVCATRIDFLDKEVIFKMKKAGCVMISLGIETCIPETLIKTKKTSNPKWYIKHSDNVLKWCYEADIHAGVNILTGFPWDNVKSIKTLQKYVKKINQYVTQGYCGGILQPMPNTEIYDTYAKEYKFEKWWLSKKSPFVDDYQPFFVLHYHKFWEHLYNNFFALDKEVYREIDKLYKMMGKRNLWGIVNRRFRNPCIRVFLYESLLGLSKFSLFLFNISPRLEKGIMKPLISFNYKFKFKK